MTQDQLMEFLAAHGGAAGQEPIEQDTGRISPVTQKPVTLTAYKFTAKDGSTITLSQYNPDGSPADGQYREVARLEKEPKPVDPSAQALDETAQQELAQKKANAAAGNGFLTNEQLDTKQRQERIDAQAAQDRLDAARRAATQDTRNAAADTRAAAADSRAAAGEDRANRAEDRSIAAASRPQIVSAPANQRKIAQMDVGGNVTSVDNPNFDQDAYNREQAKAKAQAERDRLGLLIQAGKLEEDSAAAQYKRWFEENVTLPLQRSQEARARATELREAQAAEDRRKEFAATYEKDRQTTALNVGHAAASDFNSNLPFQVGPKFGEQFAQALDSFKPGAAPAHFTQDAFTFQGPNIEAVARKATANALSSISPYAKAISTAPDRPLQTAQYDASMTPAATPLAGTPAPAPPQPIDYGQLVNDYLQNNPYGAGQEDGSQ